MQSNFLIHFKISKTKLVYKTLNYWNFLVALPETTPMIEAASLQDDLKRAGIKPYHG